VTAEAGPSEDVHGGTGIETADDPSDSAGRRGRALSALPKDAPSIRSVTSDSRHVEPFSLFIAIKGDKHDGHDHLSDAAGKARSPRSSPSRRDSSIRTSTSSASTTRAARWAGSRRSSAAASVARHRRRRSQRQDDDEELIDAVLARI
jgi:hypothetical protein